MALRVRWKWLQRTGPEKPWGSLPLQLNPVLEIFYSLAVVTEIEDGSNTLFWKIDGLLASGLGTSLQQLLTWYPINGSKKNNQ
jgi:hypothetical protein